MSYIVESILNYVKKENTDYAILLNGKWGSGKTYFWENILKDEIENLKVNEKNQKTIYVSLYGITSIEEINKRIVIENLMNKSKKVQQLVSGKLSGKITEMAKMGMGIVKSLDIPVLNKVLESDINYENLLDFTDIVLCFDDLERANLEITDILGYINNFVEHDGAKVIIIGNEKEISEKLNGRNLELKMLVSSFFLDKEDNVREMNQENKLTEKVISLFGRTNEYIRIKEKLIGKTLTIIPDYPSLINHIINFNHDEPFKEFLNDNLEIIINVFRDSNTENIRILKQGLDDFQLIFHKYQENYSQLGDEVLSAILIFTLAASFEIKSGAERNEGLSGATNNTLLEIRFTREFDKSKKSEKTYLELFIEKYYSNLNIKDRMYFFRFVEILVRKGIFNIDVFTEEMNNFEYNTLEITPIYLKLITQWYWELSDEEFIEAEKQAYQKLMNGEVHFSLYFQAFFLYRDLIKRGLIQKDVNEIRDGLLNGLELAEAKAEFLPTLDLTFRNGMLKKDDIDGNFFKEKIIEINLRLREKLFETEVKELLECMKVTYPKFSKDMKGKYSTVPVFSKFDAKDLFENVLSLNNNYTLDFIDLLQQRYNHKEVIKNYELYLDKSNLNLLRNSIDSYVEGSRVTLKISYLNDLSRLIDSTIKELEYEELKDLEREKNNSQE